MNYISCTSTEQKLLDKMDAEEKAVYLASEKDLLSLSTLALTKVGGYYLLQQFIDVSRLIIELHEKHDTYNDTVEHMCTMPNDTEKNQKTFDIMNTIADASFNIGLTVGEKAIVISLVNMDICDIVYRALGDAKIAFYNELFDYFKLSDLSQHCTGYYLR